jgi:hypothetical protein
MWEELRGEADADGVIVVECDLPREVRPGAYWPRGGRHYILIQRGLDEPLRSAVLAHELEHYHRGGGADADGMPDYWWPCVAREEARVRAAAARRAVDFDDLAELLEAAEAFGHHVTVAEVAADYDVTPADAEMAMTLVLAHRERRSA